MPSSAGRRTASRPAEVVIGPTTSAAIPGSAGETAEPSGSTAVPGSTGMAVGRGDGRTVDVAAGAAGTVVVAVVTMRRAPPRSDIEYWSSMCPGTRPLPV